jgi:hypothetical protein
MKYVCTILLLLVTAAPGCAKQNLDMSYNVHRPGGDYTNFQVPDVDGCARACRHDDRCAAFDYVSSYHQCWLKDRVPRARPARDVISGVKSGRDDGEVRYDERVPDRKSTRLNSSHRLTSRMPSSA